MKALAILGAIVSAWISGVAIGANESDRSVNAGVVFLLIAVAFGFAAWMAT